MKKVLIALFTFLVLFQGGVLTAKAAAPAYVVENKDVSTEEAFTVPVSVKDNSGIIALRLKIVYDESLLELTSVEDTGLLAGYVPPSSTIVSPYTLSWSDYSSTTDNTANGVIANLKFTAKSDAGSATVTITPIDAFTSTGGSVSFDSSAATITITKPVVHVTGVSLDQTKLSLQEGDTEQLTATVAPSDADNKAVTWSSDNTASVTVSSTGLVSAVKEGTANITVKTSDGNKTAVCVVTVSHKHSMSAQKPAVAATCETPGNVAYYTCTKCNKNFSDAAGKTELSTVVVPAIGHSPAGTWTTDEDKHWKTCTNSGCSAKLEEAAHNFVVVIDTPATEDTTGESHEACVCGKTRNKGTVIDKLEHVHIGITHHDAVAANCSAEGQKEYWTCSSSKCTGKFYGDADCQAEVTKDSLAVAKDLNAHVYDNEKDGTCNLCKYVRFYVVIKNPEPEFTLGASDDISFTVDGEFENFKELKINGKVVDKAYYTVAKGSTIITLKNSYVSTLESAAYTVEVVYTDGKSAVTTLNIKDEDDDEAPAATTSEPAVTAGGKPVSPKTGEQKAVYVLWIALASSALIAGVVVYKKKKN